MKYAYLYALLFSISISAQDLDLELKKDTTRKSLLEAPKQNPKAKYDQYRIVSTQKDTIYIDTTLTIQKEYDFNYLRNDNFGLLPLHNDGQSYNTLNFNLVNQNVLPQFGFLAKHFNYLNSNDIKYYSVATPYTELYFKTVLEQGQSIDALVTLNTSERLNFSIAYKGLRSLGKYLNSLSSSGNFRFTTNYHTKNKRYIAYFQMVTQDIQNQENGGLSNLSEFTSKSSLYKDRSRIDINLSNAESLLKGKRFYYNHEFYINPSSLRNKVALLHEISYESKYFEFKKETFTNFFGPTFANSKVSNRWNNKTLYNKISANFTQSILGNFNFFIENQQTNHFYNRTLYTTNITIPNLIELNLTAVGGKYFFNLNKIKTSVLLSKAISSQTFSTIEANAHFKINEKNQFSAQYSNLSKVPNMNFTIFQSDYVAYNWKNSFKNEKINELNLTAKTQWLQAELNIKTINNYLYFSNNVVKDSILTTPKQYNKIINYLSVQASKELKFRKFSLDNTILFQEVTQENAILNVPNFTFRNTFYYSTNVFKKAMFLQTGVTFQTFTKYYANEHNPLIGEFFIQNKTKIGNFPLFDFFINARVRQTRIYLKAEHFNAIFTKNNYFSTPTHPYRDFIVRFGLVWNFFQ